MFARELVCRLKPDGGTPGADPGLLQQVQALEAQNATLMAELSDLQARGAQQQAMLSSVEEMSAEARQQRDTNAALARELDLLQRQNARRQQVCRASLPAARRGPASLRGAAASGRL